MAQFRDKGETYRPSVERRPSDSPPAIAIQYRDQNDAYRYRSGNLPFDRILTQVSQNIGGGKFAGSEYDPETNTYRMVFVRPGELIKVEVDARNAKIKRREGF